VLYYALCLNKSNEMTHPQGRGVKQEKWREKWSIA
jgi:hypothetical protein